MKVLNACNKKLMLIDFVVITVSLQNVNSQCLPFIWRVKTSNSEKSILQKYRETTKLSQLMRLLETITWGFGYRPQYQPETPLSGPRALTRGLIMVEG